MKTVRALLVMSLSVGLGAAVASACGSNSPTTGNGGGGGSSSGGSGSGGGSSSSSGGSSSGGSSSSSSGGSSSGGATACAQLKCVAPQICCAVRPAAGVAPTLSCSDVATCTAANSVTCFGGDCPMGQVCCGPSGTKLPLGTACMPACNASGAMSRPLCSNAADTAANLSLCAPGDTCSRSSATSSTGGLYYTCHPPDGGTGEDSDGAADDGPNGADAGSD